MALYGEHVAAADVLGHFGEVADRGHEVGDVALGVRLELAGVEGFDLADDWDAAFDFVGEAMEQGAAPFGGIVAQPEVSKAFWAAATAASTSLAVKLGTVASFSPEPGSWVSNVALSEPAAALPPTSGRCSDLLRNLSTSGSSSDITVAIANLVN